MHTPKIANHGSTLQNNPRGWRVADGDRTVIVMVRLLRLGLLPVPSSDLLEWQSANTQMRFCELSPTV